MSAVADQILQGDTQAVARAATWIENGSTQATELLQELAARPKRALVVGITGPPGAGKSTLCDQLVKAIRAEGKRVAVIAVDPSSPKTGGALLGDRIRMQQHHSDSGVFIRSMATRGFPGGIAKSTGDLVKLFDAAGYEVVIIETIGVGQAEVEVTSVADVTVLVLVPGSGDDVQANKAGIIEIANVFAINKADLPGAERLEQELHAALALGTGELPPIIKVVATEGKGVAELLAAVRR